MTSTNELDGVISVVIRARNEEQNLLQLLPVLVAQELPCSVQLQLIIVDNDSTDGTLKLATEHGAEIVTLPVDHFSWGRALNSGIQAARGQLVVLLSADVLPVGAKWLASLCQPFASADVACVYGRQIPRETAPLDEWVRVTRRFQDSTRCWDIADLEHGAADLIASNACAVMRRSVWEEYRFDEASHGAEELPWARSVLKSGKRICYRSEPVAKHSHRESAMRQALRIWELEMESSRSRGNEAQLVDVLRTLGAFVKRRIRNLRFRGVGYKRRLDGLIFFPWEVSLLAYVSLKALWAKDFTALRKRW